MSEVSLHIGGRTYTVSCADGEEAHVTALGKLLDSKVQQAGGGPGSTGAQQLLYAGLFLADEVHDAQRKLEELEHAQQKDTTTKRQQVPESLAPSLERLADLLETCAQKLEQSRSDT